MSNPRSIFVKISAVVAIVLAIGTAAVAKRHSDPAFVNIPMSDSSYPKEDSISAFMTLVNDPSTGVFFAHCAGGRHRTGVVGAVYRFNVNHWSYDQAYAEMTDYDFYTRFGHGALKTFVEDYAKQMPATPATAATSTNKQ